MSERARLPERQGPRPAGGAPQGGSSPFGAAAAGLGLERAAPRRRLRVVSWNVGRLYSPWQNNRLDDRDLPQVARTLWELDPDVVLLQELVDERQLQVLLRGGAYRGALAERCRYDRHVGVLVRAGYEPSFEQTRLEPSGRGLVTATFRVGGIRAAATAVHLDVFARIRRRVQAEALAGLAGSRPEALVLLGGDLNLDVEWARRLDERHDLHSYERLATGAVDVARVAGPTLMGLLRVDHLFARGAALRAAFGRVSPRRLPLGDHDPVVGDLELEDAVVDAPAATP